MLLELKKEQGRVLIELARQAIEKIWNGSFPVKEHKEPWLQKDGAVFVTLMMDGELRGCVGSTEAYRPLKEDIETNAVAAAFNDSRFSPLEKDDWPRVNVEVSYLSKTEKMKFGSEEEAVSQLRPNLDGLIFQCGSRKSTFLPQVWGKLPKPITFFRELKQKAGFRPDFWSEEISLYRYSVQKWCETEFLDGKE